MATTTIDRLNQQVTAFPPRSDWQTHAQLVPCTECDQVIAVPADCTNPWWREAHSRPPRIHEQPGLNVDFHIGYADRHSYQVRGESFWIWLPSLDG